MISLVVAEYGYKAVLPERELEIWILRATALGVIWGVTGLNCAGTRIGTGTASVFLVLKIGGLASIALLGLGYSVGGKRRESQSMDMLDVRGEELKSPPNLEESLSMAVGNFSDAVFAALFSCGGWESVCPSLLKEVASC